MEEGSQKNTYSLGDVTQLLQGSATDIEKDDIDSAVDKLNEILTIWPNVEGEVSTRDSKLYGNMETKVPDRNQPIAIEKGKFGGSEGNRIRFKH